MRLVSSKSFRHEYLVPPQTTFVCDFLECLQYRRVGWILTIKISVRVGTNASKLAEIQQSARLEEGNGMQGGAKGNAGGGRKRGGDERRLGPMRDCMMRRPLPAVFGHPCSATNDGGGGGSVWDSNLALLANPRSPTGQRRGSGRGADDGASASSAVPRLHDDGRPSLTRAMMTTTAAASARTTVPRL